MSFRCPVCGERHEGVPDVGFDKPDYWWGVPEEERERRINFTPDVCSIDEEDFFIRGVIHIPLRGTDEDFGIGVWVSQKRENFYTYLENFDSADIGPFFGWLSNSIDYYEEETLSLKTMAHFRGGAQRPSIELEETDHPLAVAQREGITPEEAWRIVHRYSEQGDDEEDDERPA